MYIFLKFLCKIVHLLHGPFLWTPNIALYSNCAASSCLSNFKKSHTTKLGLTFRPELLKQEADKYTCGKTSYKKNLKAMMDLPNLDII